MEMVRIRTRIGTLVLAVALAAGACSGDDDASDVTVAPETSTVETTTTTEATTTTTEDPAAAVEQAFEEQWFALIEILSDPDPSNPLIDKYFAGDARDQVLDIVSRYIDEGKVAALPDDESRFVPHALDVRLDGPTTATVVECTLDGSLIILRSTGEILNDSVDVNHFVNTFELIEGQWKVTATENLEDSCEPS